MKKEKFVSYINDLKKSYDKWIALSDHAQKHTDEYFTYPTFGMFELYISLLEDAMNDTWNTISYYVWDLQFGKEGKECITIGKADADKKISLRTPEELYDYLTMEK